MQILFSGAIPSPEHQRGAIGLLGIFDVERREVVHTCRWSPPDELRAPGQKVQLTGFTWLDGSLYVCTHNAIVVYDDWPPRKPARVLSLPSWNDLHHCIPWKGGLAVANTGLESVDWISTEGELGSRIDVLDGVEGARTIDPDRDLRRIPDTKPHLRHPNHLFERGGELWVTQLETQDAVCVSADAAPLTFPEGLPHDGTRIGSRNVFTTVTGHLVRVGADPEDRSSTALAPFDPHYEELGWCRGVCADPDGADRYWVGFSMVRRPRWRQVGYVVKHRHGAPPSRICRFDLAEGRRIDAVQLGPDRGYVLFQLEALDAERRIA